MKKFLTILSLVVLLSALTSGSVLALSFDFSGSFTVSDQDGDGFAEVLDFNTSLWGKSFVSSIDPGPDGVLDVGSYVKLSKFYLDKTATGPFSFIDNPYLDGFNVYNSVGALLLQADITLAPLSTDQTTGKINASFGLNLTNIDVFYPGSPVLDAFVAPGIPGGAVNFTLNIAGGDLASLIQNGGGKGSYSASAAPVPEPGTLLLMGAGLVGLVGLRKRMKK